MDLREWLLSLLFTATGIGVLSEFEGFLPIIQTLVYHTLCFSQVTYDQMDRIESD